MARQPPAFDISQLNDQWGSPLDEIYRTILDIFTDEGEALCADARRALSAGKRDLLARAMHTMAGAAAHVAAMHLAQCARAAEEAAQSDNENRLERLMNDVEAAWRSVRAEIASGGPRADGE